MAKQLTEKIILKVEKNPILYDKSLKEYKDNDKKRDIWKQYRNMEHIWDFLAA